MCFIDKFTGVPQVYVYIDVIICYAGPVDCRGVSVLPSVTVTIVIDFLAHLHEIVRRTPDGCSFLVRFIGALVSYVSLHATSIDSFALCMILVESCKCDRTLTNLLFVVAARLLSICRVTCVDDCLQTER